MSKFVSKPTHVDRSAEEISSKFADLSNLQNLVDQLPEEQKSKLGDVKFDRDTIAIHTSQVGDITFKITDRTPRRIVFQAIGSPVPVELDVDINPVADTASEVTVCFDVHIPAMLRPMVAPHMQKAVDMLGDMIGKVSEA